MASRKMIFGMGFRLFFLSAALIFFQVGMIFLAVSKSQSLVTALDTVTRKELPARDALSVGRVGVEKARQAVYEALYAERLRDGERFKQAETLARKQMDGLGENLASIESFQLGTKVDGLVKELRSQLKEFGTQGVVVLTAVDALVRNASKAEDRILEERTKFDKLYEKVAATYDELNNSLQVATQVNDDQGRDIVGSLTRFSVVGLTVSFLIVIFVMVWTKFSFARLTGRVSIVSAKIAELSEELRDEARKTRDATISQSAAIQESASALSEMSSMIMQTGGNAKLSKDTASGAKEKAAEGGQIMERMTQAMGSIHKANTQLQEIAKIIDDITSKTTVINDIVFKTQSCLPVNKCY